jgi:glycosyltransferase involved in cell wall biosynthesis
MSEKILYIGPLKDFSGYAHAARDYIRALDKAGCNLVTRAVTYDGGRYKFSAREEELFGRDTNGVDIVIQQTTPNETQRKPGVFNVNYFAWETDRVPVEWVNQLNQMDLVLVPCDANVIACRKSGVMVPVEKIPHTFDTSKYKREVPPYQIHGMDKRFKFLGICQYARKKGVDPLLKAYFSEFRSTDKVLLILKMYMTPNDGEEQKNYLAGLINEMKDFLRIGDYAPVLLLNQVMSDAEIERLYLACDAYSLPSRGEGWSITHFDAMGYGKPPIAVNWAGPTEFVTKDTGWLVDYNMSPVCGMPHPHKFMYTGLDNWAEPHVNDIRLAMRQAVVERQNEDLWAKRVEACKKRVEQFDYSVIGPQMKETILKHYKVWRSANATN